MAKIKTGKRVIFELEFYWRGKRRKPSMSFLYAGDNYEGLPDTIEASPEGRDFNKAAQRLCRVMVETGELD